MKVAQLCLSLCDPMDYIVYGILQARILQWVAFPFSKGSSQPRDQVFHISGDSLLAEPQGKPKDTGAGILSLLQGIFLIQELNHGLLHCRQILYQLSYQGSPVCGRNANWGHHYGKQYESSLKNKNRATT